MKDKSINQLLDIVRADDTYLHAGDEILRRFAKLEKENEDLKCCGNCGLSRYDNDYGLSCSYKFKKVKPNDRYCDNWQSDKE